MLTGLYLSTRLEGEVVEIVGLGIFLYFITRAAVNIPAGQLLDAIPGNQDEAVMLLASSILMGAPFLFYPLITSPIMFYVLQIIFGAGAALHVVSSKKLVAIHLDQDRAGEQFSVYDTAFSIFIAIAGLLGGIVSNIGPMYFNMVFFGFGVLIISSGIWALIYLRMYYPERKPLFWRTLDYLGVKVKGWVRQ